LTVVYDYFYKIIDIV